MISRLLLAAASLMLAFAAVGQPPQLPATATFEAEEAAASSAPLPLAVQAAAGVVTRPLLAAQEALSGVIPTVSATEPRDAACRRVAADLIIRWEVTSPAFYTKRLERPVWPGGASGITWGIGYDGGHQTAATIADDWQDHAAVGRLARTAGITGKQAAQILRQYRDIPTSYEHASRIFEQRSLVEYERRARRAFGAKRFDALKPGACGALVSLVYNRGAAMAGDSRREMRQIRDKCMAGPDYQCMASNIRAMSRLWVGTVNERGLSARRESEARAIENEQANRQGSIYEAAVGPVWVSRSGGKQRDSTWGPPRLLHPARSGARTVRATARRERSGRQARERA